jgi:hypothetical protein
MNDDIIQFDELGGFEITNDSLLELVAAGTNDRKDDDDDKTNLVCLPGKINILCK